MSRSSTVRFGCYLGAGEDARLREQFGSDMRALLLAYDLQLTSIEWKEAASASGIGKAQGPSARRNAEQLGRDLERAVAEYTDKETGRLRVEDLQKSAAEEPSVGQARWAAVTTWLLNATKYGVAGAVFVAKAGVLYGGQHAWMLPAQWVMQHQQVLSLVASGAGLMIKVVAHLEERLRQDRQDSTVGAKKSKSWEEEIMDRAHEQRQHQEEKGQQMSETDKPS